MSVIPTPTPSKKLFLDSVNLVFFTFSTLKLNIEKLLSPTTPTFELQLKH